MPCPNTKVELLWVWSTVWRSREAWPPQPQAASYPSRPPLPTVSSAWGPLHLFLVSSHLRGQSGHHAPVLALPPKEPRVPLQLPSHNECLGEGDRAGFHRGVSEWVVGGKAGSSEAVPQGGVQVCTLRARKRLDLSSSGGRPKVLRPFLDPVVPASGTAGLSAQKLLLWNFDCMRQAIFRLLHVCSGPWEPLLTDSAFKYLKIEGR